jgi:hypothetical protein
MTSARIRARRIVATAATAAVFLCLPAFADAETSSPAPAHVPVQKTIDQAEPEIAAPGRSAPTRHVCDGVSVMVAMPPKTA